ncbi:hypothetical protein GCM10009539_62650 [Cryptosporangium japonicum]|uniref:Uncharacterized protein n=1 Tax=Cryptosporangium japonicum TaxID=80872 RepID=A0ABN0UZI8_9ACTN
MTPVELGLDVAGDLDAVHDEVGDEPVDDGVLQHDADQARLGEITFAELGTAEILVDVARHAPHDRSGTKPLIPATPGGSFAEKQRYYDEQLRGDRDYRVHVLAVATAQ